METLKPCPICGSDARVESHRGYGTGKLLGKRLYAAECSGCGVKLPMVPRPEAF